VKNPLPQEFTERIRRTYGEEAEAFLQALEHEPATSIHLLGSRYKEEIGQPVPWFSAGKYLAERPIFTLDPKFHSGAYYPQESSSMIIGSLLQQLDFPDDELRFLDLCAAPGGKTLLLSYFLQTRGLVIANEITKNRHQILRENLTRCALPNFITTSTNAEQLGELYGYFDLILVDAPCSGEGMFRKDEVARSEWSLQNVALCSSRQKDILSQIAPAVKTGGYLIYSTCTFAPEENQELLQWLTAHEEWEAVRFDLPEEWNVYVHDYPTFFGLQFLPHRVKGEGFFVTVLRKKANEDLVHLHSFGKKHQLYWSPLHKKQLPSIQQWILLSDDVHVGVNSHGEVHLLPSDAETIEQIGFHLSLTQVGIPIGHFVREEFIPHHGLALSRLYLPSIHSVELTLEDAQNYLRREEFTISDLKEGWALATYAGYPLGWMKVLKNRINNYYPKEWRIKNL
jgi:16S rRNA C967 or C1407 C5-methylase (RsmB/RsmF family)/NOL1/NOP2/fmu family ribosome biogenesis protein